MADNLFPEGGRPPDLRLSLLAINDSREYTSAWNGDNSPIPRDKYVLKYDIDDCTWASAAVR